MINAPATFQAMIQAILSDMLDMGVIVYMDDILIYAKDLEEYDRLVLEVLRRLREYHLTVAAEKCAWGVTEVEYLGYIIAEHGIAMSKEKVNCVLEWKPPTSLKSTQRFIGFANFYRRFIRNFSSIVRPLTSSTAGDPKSWTWTDEMTTAFETLKKAFISAPVLHHFDPTKTAVVETDASDFALGAILSQKGDDGRLHPVAFHSRKLQPAEMNYEIHDKELLAVMDCFAKWRRYL